ncbi:hypothetical protein X741_23050 [Mesorhizobium sp. LNHC229A00]|nr:hypothetical protein X741_23050 [Mesorhizobium sp. LNHC229A00]
MPKPIAKARAQIANRFVVIANTLLFGIRSYIENRQMTKSS